jgi:hypothetical protein
MVDLSSAPESTAPPERVGVPAANAAGERSATDFVATPAAPRAESGRFAIDPEAARGALGATLIARGFLDGAVRSMVVTGLTRADSSHLSLESAADRSPRDHAIVETGVSSRQPWP